MKKPVLTMLLLMVSTFPAYAKDEPVLCRLRAQHVARADVAYKAGVDVQGNPVAPADINAAPQMLADIVRVPLPVELAKVLNIMPEGVELKAGLGLIEIFKNGRVAYNGLDISNQMDVLCGDKVPGQASASAVVVPVTAPAAALPPQTLGQITVPAPVAPVAPQVSPVEAPVAPAPVATKPDGRTNADLEKDDKIIWGEGN